ncbi:MAG: DUF2992 family protein [Evtepia gabavorous]
MPAPCPGRGSTPNGSSGRSEKQLQTPAIGTKAQQALQLQHAQRVQTRKETARQKRTQAQHRRAALRREKHREKHRGH